MISAINNTQQIALERFDDLITKFDSNSTSKESNKEIEKASLEKANKESKESKSNTAVDFSQITDSIKNLLNDKSIAIEFSKDADSNQMIMKIINDETKEIIRQFPAELSLRIARIVSANLELKNIADVTV